MRAGAAFIAGQANDDGGFNFAGKGGPSGADDTGAALQALAAAGRRALARRAARGALARRGRRTPTAASRCRRGASNAQSTAWAVQGLIAAGRDPARVRRGGARSPLAYLRSLVGPDGAVRYSRTSTQTPVWVTGAGAHRARAARRSRSRRRRASGAPRAAAPAPAPDAAPPPSPRRRSRAANARRRAAGDAAAPDRPRRRPPVTPRRGARGPRCLVVSPERARRAGALAAVAARTLAPAS